MGIFGVGLPELVLVFVVATIVLGPERIPEVAVQLARALRFLRGYATSATAQMRTELDELTREYEEVRRELQEFRQSVRSDLTSMTDQVNRTFLEEPIVEPGGEPPPDHTPTDGAERRH